MRDVALQLILEVWPTFMDYQQSTMGHYQRLNYRVSSAVTGSIVHFRPVVNDEFHRNWMMRSGMNSRAEGGLHYSILVILGGALHITTVGWNLGILYITATGTSTKPAAVNQLLTTVA